MGVPSSFMIGHGITFGLCSDPSWIWRAVFQADYFFRPVGL